MQRRRGASCHALASTYPHICILTYSRSCIRLVPSPTINGCAEQTTLPNMLAASPRHIPSATMLECLIADVCADMKGGAIELADPSYR
jgi:hypothetical protein